MSGDSDLIKLYSTRILELTTQIPHRGRLDAPGGTARRRAPLCGSTVAVDLSVTDGRVSAFAQDVKACALGQAAAAIVGGAIIGQRREAIAQGRDALQQMLAAGAPPPDAPWHELEVLLPAREHRNRHASILLTFDAALDAFDAAAGKADCA